MQEPALIIHSDPVASTTLRDAIADAGVDCAAVVGESAGAAALREGSWTLVLLDMGLGDEADLRDAVATASTAMLGLASPAPPRSWARGDRVAFVIPTAWGAEEIAEIVAAAAPRLVLHGS